jgi:hypothetical protein
MDISLPSFRSVNEEVCVFVCPLARDHPVRFSVCVFGREDDHARRRNTMSISTVAHEMKGNVFVFCFLLSLLRGMMEDLFRS